MSLTETLIGLIIRIIFTIKIRHLQYQTVQQLFQVVEHLFEQSSLRTPFLREDFKSIYPPDG